MNKEISFIVEFDEVNDNQLNKFNEFLEDTMIKFQILKSDNEFKENTNLKQALNEIRDNIRTLGKFDGEKCTRNFKMMSADFNYILQMIDKVLGGSDD